VFFVVTEQEPPAQSTVQLAAFSHVTAQEPPGHASVQSDPAAHDRLQPAPSHVSAHVLPVHSQLPCAGQCSSAPRFSPVEASLLPGTVVPPFPVLPFVGGPASAPTTGLGAGACVTAVHAEAMKVSATSENGSLRIEPSP
jgi:hypothetical protein